MAPTILADMLATQDAAILEDWMARQLNVAGRKSHLIKDSELREQSRRFLDLLRAALSRGGLDTTAPDWKDVRGFLTELSSSRAYLGFTPTETATFVFSLKEPLFAQLRSAYGSQPDVYAREIWTITTLLDSLGLWTTEAFLTAREQLIQRQQQELLELSTPVVRLWHGILALPLIGTLDSNRTQVVMANLLQMIVETGAETAIIDITGVPTVDTLVAQHLLKTVAAARLMGGDCIISGIRPQIAQTIVHLGVNLGDVTTKATLADAFKIALKRNGFAVVKTDAKPSAPPPAPHAPSSQMEG
jgi:rsbT co-antagonist protein RsbR